MERKIEISTTALKQLKKLPSDIRQQILQDIHTLANWPKVSGIKALQGIKGYRLRSGRYRILFDINESGQVLVSEVLIRNENTY